MIKKWRNSWIWRFLGVCPENGQNGGTDRKEREEPGKEAATDCTDDTDEERRQKDGGKKMKTSQSGNRSWGLAKGNEEP